MELQIYEKQRSGISNQQYLVFRPVTEVDLAKIDKVRRCSRITHYLDSNLLIIKMSTIKHESAHLGLGTKFMFKLAKMRISDDIIRLCGAQPIVVVPLPKRATQPTDLPREGIPIGRLLLSSLIFRDLTVSQEFRKVVAWKFSRRGENRNHHLSTASREILDIEKWELVLPLQGRPVRKGNLVSLLIPIKVQDITMLPNNTTSRSLPFVLGFRTSFSAHQRD